MSRPAMIATFGLLCLAAAGAAPAASAPDAGDDAPPARAADLFARHCATCHDLDGRARGPIARLLAPPPRDFGQGLFQLVTTDNGVPTLGDLERTIERGMPGSGMPSFHWLPAEDRAALAGHVRELAITGMATRLLDDARASGEHLEPSDARALAEWQMEPEPTPGFSAFPDADAATLDLGGRLFLEQCAACHGIDGRGRQDVEGWCAGEMPQARDLTRGVLKGGTTLEDLAHRIRSGMPGRAMPPTRLPEGGTEALAVVVRRLIPPDAAERTTQRRQHLVARRAPALPDDPAAAAWAAAEEVRVVLSPLASRPEGVLEGLVAALHDGEDLALRVRWPDPTRDDSAVGATWLPDAVALQFSAEPEPPLFGMGSAHHPTNLWHWQAFRPERLAGIFDLLGRPASGVARGKPPAGLLAPEERAASRASEGVPEPHAATPQGLEVAAAPRWQGDAWSVVLRRPLAARDAGEVAFEAGREVQWTLAIWNGAAGDHGARKSVSIWNALTIGE